MRSGKRKAESLRPGLPEADRGAPVCAWNESVRLFVPKSTADSIIAAIGEQDAAVLVTVDKDLRALAPRIPKERRRYRKLGIISIRCPEPQAEHRIRQNIDLIEFEYERSQSLKDQRLMIFASRSPSRSLPRRPRPCRRLFFFMLLLLFSVLTKIRQDYFFDPVMIDHIDVPKALEDRYPSRVFPDEIRDEIDQPSNPCTVFPETTEAGLRRISVWPP